jgi:hypothetical protein
MKAVNILKKIYRILINPYYSNPWVRIYSPPIWLKERIGELQHNLYDQMMIFKGKTFVYKVTGRTIAQGQVSLHYYRKFRKHALLENRRKFNEDGKYRD